MRGYYDRGTTARILDVTIRQVDNLLKSGKLRRIKPTNRVWIPKEDVHKLFDDRRSHVAPSREEHRTAVGRIERLEHAVQILRMSMGHGPLKPAYTLVVLKERRRECLDLLGREPWTLLQVSMLAEFMSDLRRDEVQELLKAHGEMAWKPVFELSLRMLAYLEDQDLDVSSLDILHKQLLLSRERLMRLLISSRGSTVSERILWRGRMKILNTPAAGWMDRIVTRNVGIELGKSEAQIPDKENHSVQ